ncbi:MAG TPA: hypothetical protein VGH14_10320 [Solirubrobacterales bacterium]
MANADWASAATVENHYLSSRLGEGELSIEERSGIVFDQATEEVYVADTGHDRIARFSADGVPSGILASLAEPTFLAIDESSGDIYAVEEGNDTIVKLDSSGVPVSAWGTAGQKNGFGEITGIAVSPTGELFVASADFLLHALSPAGSQLTQCTLPYETVEGVQQHLNPTGLAADTEGGVYFPTVRPVRPGLLELYMAKTNATCDAITNTFAAGNSWSSVTLDKSDDSVFLLDGNKDEVGFESGATVAQYSSAGARLSPPPSVPPFGGNLEGLRVAGQIAVRSTDGTVFVTDLRDDDVAVFTLTDFEPPHLDLLAPTEITGTTARLRANINPGAPPGNPRAWRVHYAFGCVNESTEPPTIDGHCELAEGFVEPGSQAVPVERTVTGLEPGSEYRVYIGAKNAGGAEARAPEEPEIGLPFDTGAAAPVIEEVGVTGATETSVTFGGRINPRGAETNYWVEYLTKAEFEASEFTDARKTPVEVLPAGVKGQLVSVGLTGLPNSTSYVGRLVASNTVEGSVETVFSERLNFATAGPSLFPIPGSCPNETFRAFAGALLPDCRAYEQASPSDKNGGSVEAVPGSVQAPGEDGNAITFFSEAGIPGGVGAQDYPTFLSTRSNGSWTTQGLLPAQSLGEFGDYLGMTPDGRYAITEATHRGDGTGVFARDLTTGEVTTVVPYNPGCLGKGHRCFTLAGASSDGSMVFLETELELDQHPPTAMGPRNVYVWDRETGEISLVGVNQNGQRLAEGAFAGPYDWPERDVSKGGAFEGFYAAAVNAVSRDGSEMIYSERGENGDGQLFVRLGLGGPSPESVKVSSYDPGRTGPALPAAFLGATPDGRFIFFKSEAELTSNAFSGEGTESLYRYDVSTRKLTNLVTKKFQAGPGIVGMPGASESGKTVYFASTTALTAVPGPGGKTAEAGQANLYSWQEGASPAISFVATLQDGPSYGSESSEADSRDWSPSNLSPVNPVPVAKTARVSADGGTIVFSSRRALTGAPNMARGCNKVGREPRPCAEFFRYVAATKTLDCISCSPTGVQPLNGATMGTAYINAADNPLTFASPILPRNLSAGGDRFFFQTPDSLIASDRNRRDCTATTTEQESCLDVYEWEAPGQGTCKTATMDGGCLYLISSGEGEEPSYFADADPQGKNVYFFTSTRLVPADRDRLYDVYDARLEGGLASQQEVPPTRCGSQQACQGPQEGSEAASSPDTSTFVGPGNPKPRVCKRGFVRKHGKCVKKPKKKHHRRKGKNSMAKRGGGSGKKTRSGRDRGGKG